MSSSELKKMFAEIRRERKEYHDAFSRVQESDIVGLVDASGAGGVKHGDIQQWYLVLHLAAWKDRAGVFHKEMLRVEMPVLKDELSRYSKDIAPYDIIHLKGRVTEHPAGKMQSLATCIVTKNYDDLELREYAVELQKPVVKKDPLLGEFTLNRSIDLYCGPGEWQGKKIKLYLSEYDDELLDTARALWKNQQEWNKRIQDYAVDRLLKLKNENWLDDEEQEVSTENFKKRMTIETVSIKPGGNFEFCYDDGDLFWGHAIVVTGSLADGLRDADIYG